MRHVNAYNSRVQVVEFIVAYFIIDDILQNLLHIIYSSLTIIVHALQTNQNLPGFGIIGS